MKLMFFVPIKLIRRENKTKTKIQTFSYPILRILTLGKQKQKKKVYNLLNVFLVSYIKM